MFEHFYALEKCSNIFLGIFARIYIIFCTVIGSLTHYADHEINLLTLIYEGYAKKTRKKSITYTCLMLPAIRIPGT